MNGDRYPDAVRLAEDNGSGTMLIAPGTGGGFSPEQICSSPFRYLARHVSQSFGFGAHGGSPMGALAIGHRSTGRATSTTVREPQAQGGVSISTNGTVGSSYQTEGLLDINGDGLPDHLRRDSTGDLYVAMNTGDGRFSFPVSWNAGIPIQLFAGVDKLVTEPRGLGHQGMGSFGVSLGGSLDAGAIGVGASAGFVGTTNQSYFALTDINGDGLPDLTAKSKDEAFFRVRFNLGDRFAEAETRLFSPEWDVSATGALQAAIGSDLANIGAQLEGLALPEGCSLPAFSSLASPEGNPLNGLFDPFGITDALECTNGAAVDLGASLSFRIIPAPMLAFTLTPGVNGSLASASSTLRLTDIDGDGSPDHVARLAHEDFLRVKHNATAKVGLLRTIRLPQGGTIALEYERSGNTVDMPYNLWVLSSLTRDDGLSNLAPDRAEHQYRERFQYAGGYYDRGERLFYGYARVTTEYSDGARRLASYYNRDYQRRGLERSSQLWGPAEVGDLHLYREMERVVQLRSEGWYSGQEVMFPAVAAETFRAYEPGSPRFAERRLAYQYDEYGNAVAMMEEGDTFQHGDELKVKIQYAELPGYFKQHPASLRVEDARNSLLRYRRGEYGERGELVRLHQYETEGNAVTYSMSWDVYGNLAALEDPRGYRLSWQYDDRVHTYPVSIRSGNTRIPGDSYESFLSWDYVLGRQIKQEDVNGEVQHFGYDSFGRPSEVSSPYDIGAQAAVHYEYNTSVFPWQALTRNKLRYDPSDGGSLKTAVTVDGLGRTAQVAKEAELWTEGQRRTGWTCSGALAYDGKARLSAEGQPVFSEGEAYPLLAVMRKPTAFRYDALDRRVQTTLPDGSMLKHAFLVQDGHPVERVTDPLENILEQELDSRGNITALARMDSERRVLTSANYLYNPLGEILEVADAAGNRIYCDYDILGRRTQLTSPDSGRVEYRYDGAGNLIRKTDPKLRRRGEAIEYSYDGHNRLVRVDYPRSPDVQYQYGSAGASNYGAGRLIERTDESGRVEYRYGRLGELVGMKRRIERLTPLTTAVEASFSYLFDYLGRLEQVGYPDGEVVKYEYDAGGQVLSVHGEHYGRISTYVSEIGYNAFGQRSYIEYGNGVRSTYIYDENRRWLTHFRTTDSYGRVHQDFHYGFDRAGNILEIANQANGYKTTQRFSYDALYQLIEAAGSGLSHPYGIEESNSSYSQLFQFDSIGNLTRKASSHRISPQRATVPLLNYQLDYQYYADKPHQAERIGNLWYRYDDNGNLIEEHEGGHSASPLTEAELWRIGDVRIVNRGFGLTSGHQESPDMHSRAYVWDEENRLKRSVNQAQTVDYRYGADGQRTVKHSAQGETLYFDALWQARSDYPDLRCSKHIFVDGKRVATRLNFTGHQDAGYEEVNTYTYHADHLGSVQMVSDWRGEEYERIEYTPYGESWIEQRRDSEGMIPFRFTGKELDPETGLYYYGARYLDPRTSRWMSPDPAGPELMHPNRQSFRLVESTNWYSYTSNNPVKYVDPTGLSGSAESGLELWEYEYNEYRNSVEGHIKPRSMQEDQEIFR